MDTRNISNHFEEASVMEIQIKIKQQILSVYSWCVPYTLLLVTTPTFVYLIVQLSSNYEAYLKHITDLLVNHIQVCLYKKKLYSTQ